MAGSLGKWRAKQLRNYGDEAKARVLCNKKDITVGEGAAQLAIQPSASPWAVSILVGAHGLWSERRWLRCALSFEGTAAASGGMKSSGRSGNTIQLAAFFLFELLHSAGTAHLRKARRREKVGLSSLPLILHAVEGNR